MRALVIGYGSAGKRHARNAREFGHEVYVQDADTDTASQAAADGFPAMTGLAEETVNPDAAIIATPAATHRAVASDLHMAGYSGPLFVEKPLDVTTECEDFWLRWPHPTQMVGYNWRFHPEVREWWQAIDRPRGLALSCYTNLDEWPGSDYADPLLECSHELDLLRSWLPGEAITDARHGADRGYGQWGLSFGPPYYVSLAWGDEVAPGRLYTWVAPVGTLDLLQPAHEGPPLEQSYRDELDHFLTAAEKDEPVSEGATFEDGIEVVRICEQAMEMAGEAA